MRLAIINLTRGGLSGGYRKYLAHMLPGLAAHKGVDAMLCMSSAGSDVEALFTSPPPVEFATCGRMTVRHVFHQPDRAMADRIGSFSPDVVFFPAERYVGFKGIPVVNMVRNMELFVPGMKGDPPRETMRKIIQSRSARDSIRRADRTIAVSRFVRDHIVSAFGIDRDRVSQVYHGISPVDGRDALRPGSIPPDWGDDFVFTCGSIRPARGLEDLVEAWRCLRRRQINARLVIAGETVPSMLGYHRRVKRTIASCGLSDAICWTGSLGDREMQWCYRRSPLFVMTSRVEACPNVALEAMSLGALSIAADNPPLPEFFADCASYYRPGDGESLAEAILERRACSREDRVELSERSQRRSLQFAWEKTVDQTIAVLRTAIDRARN